VCIQSQHYIILGEIFIFTWYHIHLYYSHVEHDDDFTLFTSGNNGCKNFFEHYFRGSRKHDYFLVAIIARPRTWINTTQSQSRTHYTATWDIQNKQCPSKRNLCLLLSYWLPNESLVLKKCSRRSDDIILTDSLILYCFQSRYENVVTGLIITI